MSTSDLLPLIVAVTGHRDIATDAEEHVRERFDELLARFGKQYPSTPLALLCGSEPGADAIAAQVAHNRGVTILAVPAEDLDTQLAYYGHILVALWDGIEEIPAVTMRMTGIPHHREPLGAYVPDIGPVYQIVTPREGQPMPPDAFTIRELYPERFTGDKNFERDFLRAMSCYDMFDRDLSRSPEVESSDQLEGLFARSDHLANKLQTSYLRALGFLYFAAFVAGGLQLVFSGAFGLVAKILILAFAFACFVFIRRLDYENRYQDYRAVAEGLRVQFAWLDAGLIKLRVEASYLRMQQGELAWIRMALRTAYYLYVRGQRSATSLNPKGVADWIGGQRDYYDRSSQREARRARAYQVCGLAATAIALAFSIAALIALILNHPGHLADRAAEATAIAALAALLLRFYVQQRGFKENARRYHHMFQVFDYTQHRIVGKEPRTESYNDLVAELGHEALAEHASWLVLHRERPLSFVTT
jgi:hypothetical protein